MTQQQISDWCTAHVAAPVSSSYCDALDAPGGGYYINCITYKNGETYKFTASGPLGDEIIKTWINGELVHESCGKHLGGKQK
nr:MAG TPA: hypothetical protein [Bacteriophage sp.]